MVQVTVVVREIGRLKPNYSLKFALPAIPEVGDYISIRRPDSKLYTEDIIVRAVWWELYHGETRGVHAADDEIIGRDQGVVVECEPAIGLYSSARWLRGLEAAEGRGVKVERFAIERFSVPEEPE